MWLCLGIAAVGIVFFIYGGQSIQSGYWLPLLLVLACPLMMCLPMLMRHGKNGESCHGGSHKTEGKHDKQK
jgi:hypothetical protein